MSHPMADREHEFRIIVIGGMLLSLNCGFMNGVTVLREPSQTTTHVTGTSTDFGVGIGLWDWHDLYFYGGLLLVYTTSCAISASQTPSKKFSASNRYGRVLFLSSSVILVSSIFAVLFRERPEIYQMTVTASAGLMNGAMSRYSGNITRVGHVSGTSSDFGVLLGRVVMGQTEVLWKVQILSMTLFTFWLGAVIVQWVEPLLGDGVLFVNVVFMVIVGITYMVYCHYTDFNTMTPTKEIKKDLESMNDDLILNMDSNRITSISDPGVRATMSHSFRPSEALAKRNSEGSLMYVDEADHDFDLSKMEIERLHLSVDRLATPAKPVQPGSMEDKEWAEFLFIMIGASLLALNAGIVNALSSLSTRGLLTANVSGTWTRFGLTVFSFDSSDYETLMEASVLLSTFIFGSFVAGLMSSTSVFRLGYSYGRILFMVTALLFLAAGCRIWSPGSMWYYGLSTMACGLQNGMVTKYSGGVIRTTFTSGGFADIGGILGRISQGCHDDAWLLKVLVPLVTSFILGGTIGLVLHNRLEDFAPLVPATFMGVVFVSYIIGVKYVSGTELSYTQLIVGKYTYPEVKSMLRESLFTRAK